MEEEEARKKPTSHEVGMVLDALSIDELEARIGLLREEIIRLEATILEKKKSKDTAESFFKS